MVLFALGMPQLIEPNGRKTYLQPRLDQPESGGALSPVRITLDDPRSDRAWVLIVPRIWLVQLAHEILDKAADDD